MTFRKIRLDVDDFIILYCNTVVLHSFESLTTRIYASQLDGIGVSCLFSNVLSELCVNELWTGPDSRNRGRFGVLRDHVGAFA